MAVILVKNCVRPRALWIMAAAANVAQEMGRAVLVTSCNDSEHMASSKHWLNEAIDLRSKDFPTGAAKREYLARVLERLGPDYEGLLEHEGKLHEHFHIEYDPKPRGRAIG